MSSKFEQKISTVAMNKNCSKTFRVKVAYKAAHSPQQRHKLSTTEAAADFNSHLQVMHRQAEMQNTI